MEDKKFSLIDCGGHGIRVIEGGGQNIIRPKRRSLEEDQQIVCPRCNGSVTLVLTLSPRRSPVGKVRGGTKIHACAVCYKGGEIVELAKV